MQKYLLNPTAIGGFGAIIVTLVIFFAQGGFSRMTCFTYLYIIGLVIGISMIVYSVVKTTHQDSKTETNKGNVDQLIKELENIRITVGDSQKTATTLLYENWEVLVRGIPEFGGAIGYQPPSITPILPRLAILNVVRLQKRRSWKGYDVNYWVLTDLGIEVINKLKESKTNGK